MDARLDPAKFAGLSEGDAHVIRNAGGRASDDAIRSLVISHKLLGTSEWFVIHHTDCGMEFFTNELMRRPARAEPATPRRSARTASTTSARARARRSGRSIDWLTICRPRPERRRRRRRIRTHPLVPAGIPIYGYVYDAEERVCGWGVQTRRHHGRHAGSDETGLDTAPD